PESNDRAEQKSDTKQAATEAEPGAVAGSASGFWRRVAGADYRRRIHGACGDAVLLRFGDSGGEWLRADGGGNCANVERFETVSRRHCREATAGRGTAGAESE